MSVVDVKSRYPALADECSGDKVWDLSRGLHELYMGLPSEPAEPYPGILGAR